MITLIINVLKKFMVFPNSQVYDYNLTALEGTYYRFAHLYLRMQIFNFFYDMLTNDFCSNLFMILKK